MLPEWGHTGFFLHHLASDQNTTSPHWGTPKGKRVIQASRYQAAQRRVTSSSKASAAAVLGLAASVVMAAVAPVPGELPERIGSPRGMGGCLGWRMAGSGSSSASELGVPAAAYSRGRKENEWVGAHVVCKRTGPTKSNESVDATAHAEHTCAPCDPYGPQAALLRLDTLYRPPGAGLAGVPSALPAENGLALPLGEGTAASVELPGLGGIIPPPPKLLLPKPRGAGLP